MNPAGRKNAFKKLLMAVWGLATAMLLFLVALLAWQMYEQNSRALPAAPGEAAGTAAPVSGEPGLQKEVTLFFSTADAQSLAPQTTRIELTSQTAANCRRALETLAKGPESGLKPVLPPSTQIRAVYLIEDGELVVDFSHGLRDLMLEHKSSTSSEALMVYAVANTVTQEALKGSDGKAVTRVRFLMEGTALPQGAFPEHIDLSEPILPNSTWVAGGTPAPAAK